MCRKYCSITATVQRARLFSGWQKRFPIKWMRDSEIQRLLEDRRFAEAMDGARRRVAINPKRVPDQILLAEAAYLTGDADAERLTASLFQSSPGPRFENWGLLTESPRTRYACLLARRGKTAQAQRLLADAEHGDSQADGQRNRYPFAWEELAAIKALQGDADAAVTAYRQAYDRGWRLVMLTELNPAFDSIRPRPEFQMVIARMKADIARMRDQSAELRELREKTIPWLNSLPIPGGQQSF